MAPYIFAIVIDEREEKLGFKMDRRRSRLHHPVIITDTDLADNIAITTGEIHKAQEMLASVEIEAAIIGLHLNSKKTEVIHFNQGAVTTIKAKNGEEIKNCGQFRISRWMA